jgi:hypothetical protein
MKRCSGDCTCIQRLKAWGHRPGPETAVMLATVLRCVARWHGDRVQREAAKMALATDAVKQLEWSNVA